MKDVSVSIICNTYNHERYIAQALDSFLAQETDFSYEILIHDDASTDRTAEIIREYERRYPDRIFPICQSENQYSKGVVISRAFQYPRARGAYFAICEGDDFWADTHKLQRQYDYMESHPECTLCICNAAVCATDGRIIGELSPAAEDRIIPTEEVILGRGFCATNSIFSRTRLMQDLPDYFDILFIDVVIQMYLASCGTTYCFADKMAVYRKGVEGSWTSRHFADPAARIRHLQTCIAVNKAFDAETGGRYHEAIESVNTHSAFHMYWMKGDFDALKAEKFRRSYQELPTKTKIRFLTQKYFPHLYVLLNRSLVSARKHFKK